MAKSNEEHKGHLALVKSIDDIKALLAEDMKKICEGTAWLGEDKEQKDGGVTEEKRCNLVLLSPQFPDKIYNRLMKFLNEPESKSKIGEIIPKESQQETIQQTPIDNMFEYAVRQVKKNGNSKI